MRTYCIKKLFLSFILFIFLCAQNVTLANDLTYEQALDEKNHMEDNLNQIETLKQISTSLVDIIKYKHNNKDNQQSNAEILSLISNMRADLESMYAANTSLPQTTEERISVYKQIQAYLHQLMLKEINLCDATTNYINNASAENEASCMNILNDLYALLSEMYEWLKQI